MRFVCVWDMRGRVIECCVQCVVANGVEVRVVDVVEESAVVRVEECPRMSQRRISLTA